MINSVQNPTQNTQAPTRQDPGRRQAGAEPRIWWQVNPGRQQKPRHPESRHPGRHPTQAQKHPEPRQVWAEPTQRQEQEAGRQAGESGTTAAPCPPRQETAARTQKTKLRTAAAGTRGTCRSQNGSNPPRHPHPGRQAAGRQAGPGRHPSNLGRQAAGKRGSGRQAGTAADLAEAGKEVAQAGRRRICAGRQRGRQAAETAETQTQPKPRQSKIHPVSIERNPGIYIP